MKMFSVALSRNVEFSVIGIANIANQTVAFQGLLNGIPFVESADYHEVRDFVMEAVEINQPAKRKDVS